MNTKLSDKRIPESEFKKWYVLLEEEHEGPFSFFEIESKLDAEILREDDYVWSEEMFDWKKMKDVKAFKELLNAPSEEKKREGVDSGSVSTDLILHPQESRASFEEKRPGSEKKNQRRFKRLFLQALLLSLLGVVFVWQLRGSVRQFLEQRKVLGLMSFEGLSDQERRELKEVVRGSSLDSLPSVALGVIKPNSQAPYFVVGTNLPDGARFDIYIEGVSETLLEKYRVSEVTTVVAQRGLGKSLPFHSVKGKPLPLGEYRVFVTHSAQEPEQVHALLQKLPVLSLSSGPAIPFPVRIFSQKTYFLGGVKDFDYDQKLKHYHEVLAEKARLELLELSQCIATLEDQLSQLTFEFQKLVEPGEIKKSQQKAAWSLFDQRWSSLEKKLDASFEQWTPEWLEENIFYNKLYGMVRHAGKLVQEVHEKQKSFFKLETGEASSEVSMELQVAEAVSLARSVLLSTQARLQIAKKLPLTANGMPRQP